APFVEVDRLTDEDRDRSTPAEELDFAVARHDRLDAPVRHGDHRDADLERDPRRTGLAAHWPQGGLSGERALRVYDDGAAVGDDLPGRADRTGAAAIAFYLDLLRVRHDLADERDFPDRRLREESRKAADAPDELDHVEDVKLGVVVRRE